MPAFRLGGFSSVANRRALVIDEDERFSSLIRKWLVVYGFDVHATGNGEDGLAQIRELKPDVVFIAVDLPRKEGFSLFSKAKRLARRVPFVLSTATVPRTELKVHEKLKVHADVYLDKRTVTKDELLPILDDLIGLGPARFDLETGLLEEEGGKALPEGLTGAEEAPGGAGLEDGSLLSSALTDEEEIAGGQVPAVLPPEPENELDRLRWELEEVRRAAATTPFSQEFLGARQIARQKEKEAAQLKEQLLARNHQLAEARKKIDELSRTLTETVQAEVQKVRNEAEALRQRFTAEAQQAAQALAWEQQAHQQTRAGYEAKLAELEAAHADLQKEAQQERAAALAELERKQQEENTQAVAAEVQKAQDQAENLKWQHTTEAQKSARALEQEQQAHRETRREYESKLAELEALHADAQVQAEEDRAAALSELEGKRLKEKIQAVAAVEAVEVHWKEKLEQLRGEHDGVLADREEKTIAALKATVEDLSRAQEAHKRDLAGKEETITSLKAILIEKGIFLD